MKRVRSLQMAAVSILLTASVDNPELITNFNAAATYSHATVAVTASNPALSISTSGTSASIGLQISGDVDCRTAITYRTYTPS